MKQLVVFLERQIPSRLGNQDSERKNARHIKDEDFQEMLAKMWLLGKNKDLLDESLALKLEKSEVK